MQTQYLSTKRGIFLFGMFIYGSSAIMGLGTDVKQDTWIALLMAGIFIIPLVLLYGRIMRLYPEKNIYDIVNLLFGKIFGTIITVFFVWYCIHLASLVLKNYSEFLVSLQYTESPELGLIVFFIPVIIYVAKKGVKSLSKWASVVCIFALFVMIVTTIFALKDMKIQNLLPVMEHSFGDIANNSYQIYTFPFAETVVFLALASYIPKKVNSYKLFVLSLIIAVAVMLIILLRNILLGGVENLASQLYPSYFVVKLIKINDSLSRFEVLISLTFVLCGIGKIVVCIIGASKGFAKMVKVKDYKLLIVPCALLVFALCTILFKNATQEFDFILFYGIYSIFFQLGIPALIWITAEVKHKKQKALQNNIQKSPIA